MVDAARLHALVPAAEELDLLEEHAEAEHADHCADLLRQAAPDEQDDEDVEAEAPADDEVVRLSDGQVLGLVEHLLGARVVDDAGAVLPGTDRDLAPHHHSQDDDEDEPAV